MTYLSAVQADAPQHFWRCADPGGHILHDLGATPFAMSNMAGEGLPYSGVSSEGGASLFGFGSKGGILSKNVMPLAGWNWSLECWVFTLDLSGSGPSIFTLNAGAATTSIELTPAGAYQGGFTGFGGNTKAGTAGGQLTNKWHHCVLTYDHVNLRFYFDGALAQTVAIVADASANYDTFLAQSAAGTQYTMALCEIATYTAVLTLAQVAAHYAAADTKTTRPVYKGGGATPSYPGALGGPYSSLEAAIYASVRKTY